MRGFDTTLAAALVDGRYGEGAFEHPEHLVVNPDADPKDWKRTAPKYTFNATSVDDYTKDELAAILNYCSDLRAQWRISNTKARIAAAGRETATKQLDKLVLTAVEVYNSTKSDVMLESVIDSLGKSEVIRILNKNRVMVPSHPLLTK